VENFKIYLQIYGLEKKRILGGKNGTQYTGARL
jgi:hypothetical protein